MRASDELRNRRASLYWLFQRTQPDTAKIALAATQGRQIGPIQQAQVAKSQHGVS